MEIRLQSAFTASLALLLGDTVMHGTQLQIVMTVWYILKFVKFEVRQTAILVCRMPHPTQQVQILKKVRQTAI